jgi:hypothetical protein
MMGKKLAGIVLGMGAGALAAFTEDVYVYPSFESLSADQ